MSNIKPFVHPDLKRQLFNTGEATAEVAAVAQHLTYLMQNIHGGRWRCQIEHSANVAMIFIVPRLESQI